MDLSTEGVIFAANLEQICIAITDCFLDFLDIISCLSLPRISLFLDKLPFKIDRLVVAMFRSDVDLPHLNNPTKYTLRQLKSCIDLLILLQLLAHTGWVRK
jgi:hypothetical protein